MILPIYAYGHPVLKKKAEPIPEDYPDLQGLVDNMWETMYAAEGVGLAGPQVGLNLRIFLIDTTILEDSSTELEGIKQAFINAQKIEEGGASWDYQEGCLSIPDVTGDVKRPAQIKLRYYDTDFNMHERIFTGMEARVIQHEYDHIEGILFTDLLKPLKRRMVRKRLENIKKGNITARYKMKFTTR
ncbi:MAG: peptide deformylase [Bacteroidota bacterium]